MVTRSNVDDRLETVKQRQDDHVELAKERSEAHRAVHAAVAESLRDYKVEANEWRQTLQDLRLTFMPKGEFLSEHRALEAKLHGEIQALAGIVTALDTRIDTNTSDIKDTRTEQTARRSVFADSRNVLGTAGILFGIVASVLLILDRLTPR